MNWIDSPPLGLQTNDLDISVEHLIMVKQLVPLYEEQLLQWDTEHSLFAVPFLFDEEIATKLQEHNQVRREETSNQIARAESDQKR